MNTIELCEELGGTRCRCGNEKMARQTFCRACYFRLPPDLRQHLYRGMGAGYEEAYAAATKALGRMAEGQDTP